MEQLRPFLRRTFKKKPKLKSIKYENEESIQSALLEIFIYLIFLTVTTIVANSTQHIYLYYFNQTIEKLFFEKQISTKFNEEVSFKGLVTTADWWSFLETNFLNGLHGDIYNSTSANGSLTNSSLPNGTRIPSRLLRDNILLGPPRLRQMRVKDNSCNVHQAFYNYFNSCYAPYSEDMEDCQEEYKGTKYYTRSELKAVIVNGEFMDYYGGGYVKQLSYTRIENEQIFEQLKMSKWVDRGTRIIILEFVVFNTNAYLFNNVKILAEMPPVGGIVPSRHMHALKFSIWMEESVVMHFLTAVFYFMALFYTFEEIYEMIISGIKKYVSVFWNIIDLSILIMVYLSLLYNILHIWPMKKVLEAMKADNTNYLSIDYICYWNEIYINMMAVCVFMVWIKVFKFISFNKTLLQFTATIKRCAKDLLGFSLMFSIVFVAYAQLGLLLFGTIHPDFRNFGSSVITLMRMFLGDFEYHLIEEANYVLGPIYFITYVILVFFILLNMFLAIINDTYISIKSEILAGRSKLGEYIVTRFKELFKFIYKEICWKGTKKDKISSEDFEQMPLSKVSKTSDTYGDSRLESSADDQLVSTSSQTPIRITRSAILNQYFVEVKPEQLEQFEKTEIDPAIPKIPSQATTDEINRMKNRINLLEDLLEQLVVNMDQIFHKINSKKIKTI